MAYLNAKIHDIKNIYFAGSYIGGLDFTMETLTFAVDYWSQKNMKAMYLKRDGFLGAIGAMISHN